MFTGIIETTAKLLDKNLNQIIIEKPKIFTDIKIGQSISVNGACLTVTKTDSNKIQFDVVPETFMRTNLGKAKIVNLERAMPANGRFEGHIVQGHVDGKIKLLKKIKEGKGERFVFEKPLEKDQYFVQKGSITLNGISLTIAKDNKDTFEVAIIPHTLNETNFAEIQEQDEINFECDIIAKLLEKWKK